MKKNTALKVSIILTYCAMALLVICTVALPWLVTWYVEKMGRSQKLPAIIMVTCYPCVPFALALLLYLRKFLKNIGQGNIISRSSAVCCGKISVFCLIMSVITIVAGRFYLPFFLIGMSLAFFGLLVTVFKTAILFLDKNTSDE